MFRILKYQLPIAGKHEIFIPSIHKILTIQLQNGIPTLWVMVKEISNPVWMNIKVFPTDYYFDCAGLEYIGTVQLEDGRIVLHYYYEV